MSELGEIAAELLAAERAAELAVERPPVDFSADLHAKQLAFYTDPSDRLVVRAGRRGGKSEVVIRKHVSVAASSPETVNPYVSITRGHAKRNFWKLFKRIALATGLAHTVNESELTIDFERSGGGLVWLGGADKINELEKYRASKTAIATVDECGTFPSANLQTLVEDTIEPSLLDLGETGGTLILSGTPGKRINPDDYWYQQSGPAANGVHYWTAFDNPFIKNVEAKLAKIRAKRGWTEKSPSYVREYLGIWIDDPEGLVYPFDLDRNGIDALPLVNSKGRPLDVKRWRYAIGVDPAGVGITGFAVMACHPDLIGSFMVESSSHEGMMVGACADRCRALREKYPSAVIVMDTGGLGSVHAQEFTKKYAIGVIPAKKTEAKSAIRWSNEQIVMGTWKVVNGPANDAWREAAATIGWDEKGEGHEDGAIDHVPDAANYAERHLMSYVTSDAPADPLATPEVQAQALRAAHAKRHRKAGNYSWDH